MFYLFLSNTDTEIWSKEGSMGPYVAKMLFLQVDEGSSYTDAWCKSILANIVLFNCSDRLVAELRKI